MKHNIVQPLNYSAHALKDLAAAAIQYDASGAPKAADVIRRLTTLLRKSVKFILPNQCNLVEGGEIRQAHLDLSRLPFPVVAFEAPWVPEEGIAEEIGGFPQTVVPRRIALCWQLSSEVVLLQGMNEFFLQAYPSGGTFIASIGWLPATGQWSVWPGGAFLPYGSVEREFPKSASLHAETRATILAAEAQHEVGLHTKRRRMFTCEPLVLLPEVFEGVISSVGRDQAYALTIMDSRDDTQMFIQACSVINCANVQLSTLAAPHKLNKKRKAKGKEPFFSYKVLELTDDASPASGVGGGRHRGPRMHLRRGHLRRLSSAKSVWVRPAIVNAGSKRGVVSKDYAVSTTLDS